MRIGARNPADYTGALVNEPPLSVGVRNPFVYAEHKLGEINWNGMSPGKKRKKLEDAFDGKPYNQLFDSRNDSPLFVQTGDVRPCATVSNPTWGSIGSTYTDKTRAYDDPVQGDLPDCYFIAALSSIAFVGSTTTETNLILNQTGPNYSYSFWNPPSSAPVQDPQPVTITNKLPLDSTGKYRYSKSFTAGEIWVAMYEKAFAAWKKRSLEDTPDYSLICTGDPVLALLNITGWKYDQNTTHLTKSFGNGDLIYSKIDSVCQNKVNPNPPPLTIYRTTLKPMVAYTYDPRIETPPSGITYEDATIVANHAYSVLGVLTQGGNKYIVMRNPWGQKGAGPGFGDPDPTKLPLGALASGKWYLVPELSDPNDAVFALKANVFKDYFKGFGWVTK